MRPKPVDRVFVMETSGRALVAFEAFSRREATALRKEEWFCDELLALRSERQPIWDGQTTLYARNATPDEVAEFQAAKVSATNHDADGMLLVYLVPLDGTG